MRKLRSTVERSKNPVALPKGQIDLYAFLERLDAHNVWYRLERSRETVCVFVDVPGERWEVEFFADGDVEIERFRSISGVEGPDLIEQLFRLAD